MKFLTFRAKTAIGSFLLVSIFFGVVGIIAENVLIGIIRTAATITLQNEVQTISNALETLSGTSTEDHVDLLPPGQLGYIVSPAGQLLLNSLRQFSANEIAVLRGFPTNEMQKYINPKGTFWVLNASVEGPEGQYHVLVLQNNDYGAILTKRTQLFFLFLGLGLLLIFTIGAWKLASFVLSPVREMQQHAQAMILWDKQDALPVPGAKDELRDLATTLNELLDRLHSSLEREKRLVADVSHELRTPLSILQLRLDLLSIEKTSVLSRSEISNLSRTTKQMSSLVDNLLYIARQEKGSDIQNISAEEARILIPIIIDSARVLAADKNIAINFDIRLDSGLEVSHDALQRIITNLLSNAINASNSNSNIHISIFDQANGVVLRVDDEGAGFPLDFLPVAFERFTRADTARTKETGGSGLGLALVKSILDTYGAHITLSNQEPYGARVEILFRKFPHSSD